MKKISLSLIALSTMFVAVACKSDGKKDKKEEVVEEETIVVEEKVEEVKTLTIELTPKSESTVKGSAVFKQENGEVTMTATFEGLTPGEHAIHLHEKADCSSPDGKSTGGHWNPTFEQHGKWGDEAGYHKGDIGNFTADENGKGTITFTTDEWCINCDDDTKNIVGKAVIVHQGTDDFTSQPSGAAGARVSCGGIIE
ncbi:superoxide dismutase, Cu-Zn family [Zhouia amylolytica]|uniref:Superoxide dismutase copper/zinc binding protein n=2 Tax=Zhouia amylolytica TaxID=376730 RepID=W2URA0_9FLAO|nr:superoxide dismutase family protein [Zhouia amylolytica]ETN96006.1 superoxide dismutase copper/zinc binding protein [Zhouia amylolytica AD3]SFS51127.1 superoxide dismutase, Cu-Zn family [Zhouia amylolytica]